MVLSRILGRLIAHTGCARACRQMAACGMVLLQLVLACVPVLAQGDQAVRPAEDAPAASSTTFRRIYAPAEKIRELIEGSYLPMKRQDFEQLVASLAEPIPAAVERRVWARQAVFTARFDGRQLVNGKAEIELVSQAEPETVALPLEPLGLAVTNPSWQGRPEEPVRWGTSTGYGTVVLLSRSGTLQFDWSQRGQLAPRGAIRFELQLPPSATNRLVLDIPGQFDASVDQGVVTNVVPVWTSSGNDEMETAQESPVMRWHIELGGRHTVTLWLRPRTAAQQAGSVAQLRQANYVQITRQGIRLTTDLYLDDRGSPLDRIVLGLSGGLQLVSARAGDQALSWSSTPEGTTDESVQVLELPPLNEGAERVIRLSAIGPLVLDRTWSLPRIHVHDVQWQQEKVSFDLSDPLELRDLQLQDCIVQSRSSEPSAGEEIELHLTKPDAQIDLQVGYEEDRVQLIQGTTVQLTATEAVATTQVQIQVQRGNLFHLDAVLSDAWNVESVESEPAALLEDWTIANHETGQRLQVRLHQPVQPAMTARLKIRAKRRLHLAGQPVPVTELLPLHLEAPSPGRSLAVFQASEASELRFSGGTRTRWVLLRELSASETELVGGSESTPVLVVSETIGDLAVQVEGPTSPGLIAPPFAGDIRITATRSAKVLRETFQLHIRPQSEPIQTVHVVVSRERSEPCKWQLVGTARELPARRLEPLRRAEGELWEIVLPEPQTEPFELRGERSTVAEGNLHVALAGLPTAASQQGLVTVVTDDPSLQITADVELQKLAPALPAEGEYPSERVAYRYNPATDALPKQRITLALPPADRQFPEVLVWLAETHTLLDVSGVGGHLSTLLVENFGASELVVEIPAGADLERLVVDEREIAQPLRTGRRLTVPLPTGIRFPVVAIYYRPPRGSLPVFAHIDYPRLQIFAPVLEERWSIAHPAELALSHPTIDAVQPYRSASVLRRFFGPLVRPEDQAPANLFSRSLWSVPLPRVAGGLWGDRAQAFLELLGRSSQDTTWGDVARHYAELTAAERKTAPPLMLDTRRLSARGITPVESLPEVESEQAGERGRAVLAAADLLLLVSDEQLILTAGTARSWPEVQPTFVAEVGILTTSMQGRWVEGQPISRLNQLEPAATWHDAPRPIIWSSQAKLIDRLVPSGWGRHRLNPAAAPQLLVYRHSTIQLWTFVVFLIGAAVSLLVTQHSRRGAILLAGGAATVTLLIPAPLVPVATGLLWSVLVGFLLYLSSRRLIDAQAASADRPAVSGSRAALTTATVVGIALLAVSRLAGQEATPVPAPGSSTYEVYFPIDNEGEAAGQYVFVPEPFYRQLLVQSARRKGVPPEWLLRTATYHASVRFDPSRRQSVVHSITASYELEVSSRRVDVRWVVPGPLLTAFQQSVRLDGQRIPVEVDRSTGTVRFQVSEPGEHLLEVEYSPEIQVADGALQMDLPLIPAIDARLVVSTIGTLPELEIPSAWGQLQRQEGRGQLNSELGAARQLILRWPIESPLAAPIVRQLTWLDVQPDAVIQRIRLIADPGAATPPALRLLADRRLTLVRGASDAPTSIENDGEGDKQRFHFVPKEDAQGRWTVDAEFRLASWSGVGHVQAPRVEVRGAELQERWCAVSGAPSLLIEPAFSGSTEAIPPVRFAQAWGPGATAPQFSYRIGDETRWEVRSRPVGSQPSATVQAVYEIGTSQMTLGLLAAINPRGVPLFQQQIDVPENLHVSQITLMHNGRTLPVRWLRTAPGQLRVFLRQALDERFQLLLMGHLPVGPQQSPLPMVWMQQAETASYRVLVHRRPGVQAELHSTADWTVVDRQPALAMLDAILADRLTRTRHVGALRCDSRMPPPAISVQTNPGKAHLVLAGVLRNEPDGWSYDAEIEVQATEGVIDGLQLQIPASWSPTAADEQVQLEFAAAPQAGYRRLEVWFSQPVEDRQTIRLSGRLQWKSTEPLQVPEITFLDQATVEGRLFLPRLELDGQWTTEQLQPPGLSPDDVVPATLSRTHQPYRIIGPQYRATRRAAGSLHGVPQITLCDMQVRWTQADTCYGVATYDLEPAGLTSCRVELPARIQLVHVQVDGIPMMPRLVTGRSWELPLGASSLPQRIQLIFGGEGACRALSEPVREFLVPTLTTPAGRPIDIERTLWTVYGPPEMLAGALLDGRPAVTGLLQDIYRLKDLDTLFELAAGLVGDQTLDVEARDRWYRAWTDSFLAISRRAAAARPAAETAAELQRLRQRHQSRSETWGVEDSLQELANQRLPIDTISRWDEVMEPPVRPSRHMLVGGAPSFRLRYLPRHQNDRPFRWAAALLTVIATAVSFRRSGHAATGDALRWLPLVGVLLGLSWWWWLWPSLFGWLLIGLSLLTLLLPRWAFTFTSR